MTLSSGFPMRPGSSSRNELTGYRFFDEKRQADARFDLVFKPSQIFTWHELRRMVSLGGRLAFTHQDIIAARCDHLSDPKHANAVQNRRSTGRPRGHDQRVLERDFATFYRRRAPFEVIHHGTHEDSAVTDNRATS